MKLIIDVPLSSTDLEGIRAPVKNGRWRHGCWVSETGEQPRVVRLVWIDGDEREHVCRLRPLNHLMLSNLGSRRRDLGHLPPLHRGHRRGRGLPPVSARRQAAVCGYLRPVLEKMP